MSAKRFDLLWNIIVRTDFSWCDESANKRRPCEVTTGNRREIMFDGTVQGTTTAGFWSRDQSEQYVPIYGKFLEGSAVVSVTVCADRNKKFYARTHFDRRQRTLTHLKHFFLKKTKRPQLLNYGNFHRLFTIIYYYCYCIRSMVFLRLHEPPPTSSPKSCRCSDF